MIDVVSEKTGYPSDVLELDMQLDADLGIDSIKRVEILSSLQERMPSLPSIPPEVLGKLQSLRSIVEAISDPMESNSEPVPAEAAAPGVPVSGAAGEIAGILVETVADKTGYPAEMLELDMRLDIDLGIDSIKRVEIFSALSDRLPGIRAAGPEEIGTLGTLRDIVAFLEGAPAAPGAAPVAAAPTQRSPAGLASAPASKRIDDVSHESGNDKAGSPIGMIELDFKHANGVEIANPVVLRTLFPRTRPLELPDRRAEVVLRNGGTVWISDDGSPLAHAVERRLTERGFKTQVLSLGDARPPSSGERLCGLIVLAPREGSEKLVANAFRLVRAAGPALEESAARGGAAMLTVSRLDGSFGLSGLGTTVSPISGALAGLAKTAAREWPSVNCKAMDVDAAFDVPEGAARVIVEEFLKIGPHEVGLSRQGRTVIMLEAAPPEDGPKRRVRKLAPGDVVVISGGGRGITAEVAVALAQAFQPRLVLLGRSPVPGREEDWLAGIADEAELNRALAARSHRRLTPHELGQESRRILAEREVRRNLERITAAGSPVVYHSVDVRDGAAVKAAMARVARELGPIRGLVHGAGVLADRKIVDQTDDQFDLVYKTKVDGLNHLFGALEPEALALLFLFSSSTARFGRAGQVAYAAANEYLNKWAQQQAVRLKNCRVVSFNWGPWAGGMVTRALKPIFEQEGHGLIPLDAGAKLVVEEAARR